MRIASPMSQAEMTGEPRFEFLEPPGPHAVGLKAVMQEDHSRVFQDYSSPAGIRGSSRNSTRPIQTLIWYPASEVPTERMRVKDYTDLWTSEIRTSVPTLSYAAKQWVAGLEAAMADRLWAMRDAVPVSGIFPTIIYAPSFSAPAWENADLCEYLASHGYIVVASASMGASTRKMTSDLEGIEAQARDISFLIGFARSIPNADSSSVAVIGYSWGGISNLFAAARDTRIDALVCLDGSLRYWSGLVRRSGYVKPERLSLPLLYFAQGTLTLEEQERYLTHNEGPNVLNAWKHGDLTLVHMLGMDHSSFCSMHQRNENMWWKLQNVLQRDQGNFGRADAVRGYGWVARYTRCFLDAYLLKQANAMGFLKRMPAQNGVPRYVMSASFRSAQGPPVSFDAYRRELEERGFEQANEVYDAVPVSSRDSLFTEDELNNWAEELLGTNQARSAIALLRLCVRLHPASSEAFSLLGDAYESLGDRQQAADSFRIALEKDPLNADAALKLHALARACAS